jgi:ABC-type hemin transport system substrate-binding protein
MKKIILCGAWFAVSGLYAERIVTVGAMASELVCDLGRCSEIVAVDVTSVYPRELSQKPKVGYVSKLSAEGILSMKPTMLIYVDGAGPAQVLQQLEQSGVKIHKLSKDLGLKAARERILMLGKILNEEDNRLRNFTKANLPRAERRKFSFSTPAVHKPCWPWVRTPLPMSSSTWQVGPMSSRPKVTNRSTPRRSQRLKLISS